MHVLNALIYTEMSRGGKREQLKNLLLTPMMMQPLSKTLMRCVLLQPLKYIISLKVVPDGMFERLGKTCLSIQSERDTIKEVVVKITG